MSDSAWARRHESGDVKTPGEAASEFRDAVENLAAAYRDAIVYPIMRAATTMAEFLTRLLRRLL